MSTIRIRVTAVFEYEADPEDYMTSDPAAIAKIDYDAVENGRAGFDDLVSNANMVTFIVAPAETASPAATASSETAGPTDVAESVIDCASCAELRRDLNDANEQIESLMERLAGFEADPV
jgi:hypothetical protein